MRVCHTRHYIICFPIRLNVLFIIIRHVCDNNTGELAVMKFVLIYQLKKNRFMLYSAYSKVGGSKLVLRHSVSHFPIFFSRYCVLSGDTHRSAIAQVPERRSENINKFIPSMGMGSNPQRTAWNVIITYKVNTLSLR